MTSSAKTNSIILNQIFTIDNTLLESDCLAVWKTCNSRKISLLFKHLMTATDVIECLKIVDIPNSHHVIIFASLNNAKCQLLIDKQTIKIDEFVIWRERARRDDNDPFTRKKKRKKTPKKRVIIKTRFISAVWMLRFHWRSSSVPWSIHPAVFFPSSSNLFRVKVKVIVVEVFFLAVTNCVINSIFIARVVRARKNCDE